MITIHTPFPYRRIPVKKILFSLLLLLGAIPVAQAQAPAMPESVLFYPDMAQVTVVERLTPTTVAGRRGLLLHLPGNAMDDGFSVTVAGEPAGPGIWYIGADPDDEMPVAVDPEDETNQERRALLQTLLDARREKGRLEGELATVVSRLKAWDERKSPKEEGDKPEDLDKLDTLLAERLPKLHASREELGRLIEVQGRKIQKAEKALGDYDEDHQDLKVLLPADEMNGPVEVRYTYAVPASMGSKYRILAEPANKRLAVVQEVTLEQHSGMDWKDVKMSVSTLRRQQLLAPQYPALWPVTFVRVVDYKSQADYAPREMMDEAPAPLPAQINVGAGASGDLRRMAKPAPVAEDRSTFRLWDLGKRSLEDGRSTDVEVLKNTHEATFFYVLRPATDRMGFLCAEVETKEPQELPPGQARFYVDGVLMGEAPFAFNGDKGRFFLGQDPRVTATMRDLKREAGTQGFLSKENTVVWHWEIEVRNARSYGVNIQVEDPAPNPAADVFSVKLESKPVPESVLTDPLQGGRKIYRWSMELKPGVSSVIDHQVTVSGPSDKPFEPGRGTR